jgi:hypothetical protein
LPYDVRIFIMSAYYILFDSLFPRILGTK